MVYMLWQQISMSAWLVRTTVMRMPTVLIPMVASVVPVPLGTLEMGLLVQVLNNIIVSLKIVLLNYIQT